MEVSKPPAKLARFSEPGLLTMGGPSIGLALGLGPSGKSAFTFLQLQEFEHQALIFKYMVAGVPVPFHLVLPIWKSIGNSVSGLGCGSLCFDYRNSMEPEPGRCRRTDGKKWRCSKDVVPDQKYCERHMHRGRHRSRKPVEGNAAASNAMITTTTNSNLAGSSMDSSTQLSISMPGAGGLQLMTTIGGNASLQSGFSPTSVLHAAGGCKVETSSM